MREKYEIEVQEEEISLVDLCLVLFKHRMVILIIGIVVSLGSLGGALYIRSNVKNKTVIDYQLINRIDGFYTNKAKLHIKYIDIDKVFNDSNVIVEMFKEKEVKDLFNMTNVEDTELNRRLFLEKLITQEKVMSDESTPKFLYYRLSIENQDTKGKQIDEKIILEKYLSIINEIYSKEYSNAINEKYELTKEAMEKYKVELEKLSLQVQKIIGDQPVELLGNENALSIIKQKYPELFSKQEEVNQLYIKYRGELIGIEGVEKDPNLNTRVEKVSSYYEIKSESKAKLVLAIGIVLGLILGILGAFALEFIGILKKEVKDKI